MTLPVSICLRQVEPKPLWKSMAEFVSYMVHSIIILLAVYMISTLIYYSLANINQSNTIITFLLRINFW